MSKKVAQTVSALCVALALVASVAGQQQRPARTPTGFYYPVNFTIHNDGNWLACGSSYYADTRHIGADLIYGKGTPVYTIAPGAVLYRSGPNQSSGWGVGNYALAIRHSAMSGDFIAVYGHIQTSLKAGDKVSWGQQIGTIGRYYEIINNRTVERTPHLHFGIFPSANGFPTSGWGRITDVKCRKPGITNGFVAPISWIQKQTPRG